MYWSFVSIYSGTCCSCGAHFYRGEFNFSSLEIKEESYGVQFYNCRKVQGNETELLGFVR